MQAWGPGGEPLTPPSSQTQPKGAPPQGPRPTLGEGSPGTAWGLLASPAPRNAPPVPRTPQPSPVQADAGTKRREGPRGPSAEGQMREDEKGARGGRKKRRWRYPPIPQEKLVCARPQGC